MRTMESGRSCTGQREGTWRTVRGRRSPGPGQQGRAPGAELVQQNRAVSHAAGGAVEQRVSQQAVHQPLQIGWRRVVAPPGCHSWPGRSARGRRSPPVDRQHCHRHSAPHSRRLTPKLVAFCARTPAHNSCVAVAGSSTVRRGVYNASR